LEERERAIAAQQEAFSNRERSEAGRADSTAERERTLAAREQELETAQREVQQQAARAAENEAALVARSAEIDAREAGLQKQGETPSANTDEVNSLQAGFESERAGWNRERRQFQSDKAAAEEALKQSERKIRTIEAEYRELAQRQKYLERDRESLRRQKDDPEPQETRTGQPTLAAVSRSEEAASHHGSAGVASAHAPASSPKASTPTHGTHLEDASDKDSIAAYMERLLARNRQSKTDGEICWLPDEKDSSKTPSNDDVPAAPVESFVADAPEVVPGQVPLPGPSHTQDKATVRADLDSLRNIANSAARSAIAKYTTKSTREKILFRTLLLTITFLVAAVLLMSPQLGIGNHRNIGWIAVAACGALGIDILFRTSKRFRRSEGPAPTKRSAEPGEPETPKTSR
jgi:hypothetical protein